MLSNFKKIKVNWDSNKIQINVWKRCTEIMIYSWKLPSSGENLICEHKEEIVSVIVLVLNKRLL